MRKLVFALALCHGLIGASFARADPILTPIIASALATSAAGAGFTITATTATAFAAIAPYQILQAR